MGEIAGVNTASLGGYLHSSKTRARWAKGFHDELNFHPKKNKKKFKEEKAKEEKENLNTAKY